MSPFLQFLTVACLIALAESSCYVSRTLTRIGEYGTKRKYCWIQQGSVNLTVDVGSHLKIFDTCFEYDCGADTMSACGFGSAAGVFSADGCLVKSKACVPYFIQDPASSTRCIMLPPIILPTTTRHIDRPDCDNFSMITGPDTIRPMTVWEWEGICSAANVRNCLSLACILLSLLLMMPAFY